MTGKLVTIFGKGYCCDRLVGRINLYDGTFLIAGLVPEVSAKELQLCHLHHNILTG
jgi:hypothetical protein